MQKSITAALVGVMLTTGQPVLAGVLTSKAGVVKSPSGQPIQVDGPVARPAMTGWWTRETKY